MIITTTDTIPSKEIDQILGIARGSTVRARNIGRDIFAGLKNIVGGEISEYTRLQAISREQAMQRMIDETQKNVTGDVKLKLFKGNVNVTGRRSPFSKYKISLVSFDEVGGYDQRDAEGFIKINY